MLKRTARRLHNIVKRTGCALGKIQYLWNFSQIDSDDRGGFRPHIFCKFHCNIWLHSKIRNVILTLSLLIFKSPVAIELSCMGCDTGALHTTKPTNIAELKTSLLSIWNDLPQEFTDKAILSFRKRLIVCCCSWQTLWTLSLNTERAADIHYWNVWSVHEKAVQFDSLLPNIQDATVTACSLEKNELWSLNCCFVI